MEKMGSDKRAHWADLSQPNTSRILRICLFMAFVRSGKARLKWPLRFGSMPHTAAHTKFLLFYKFCISH
jgi:hypothetical protein